MAVQTVMELGDFDALEVTEAGLREGVFYSELLDGRDPPLFEDVRRDSVLNLAATYDTDFVHVEHVARLALSMWDALGEAGVHPGDDVERELLWAAAMLHDIGTAVDYDDHHKHSRYLILNAGLPGYTTRETALIGQMARYHRKGNPSLGWASPLTRARRRRPARPLRGADPGRRAARALARSGGARGARGRRRRPRPAAARGRRGRDGRVLGGPAPERPVRARVRARAGGQCMSTVRPTVSHMTREARMVLRGSTVTHQFLRARLTLLVGLTLVVDAVGTVLMYWFEGGAKGSDFDDLGGALFWVTAQLTTVSSQMANPVTTPGRVLDILLEVWSISVVATAAGSFAAFFHARHLEGHAQPEQL